MIWTFLAFLWLQIIHHSSPSLTTLTESNAENDCRNFDPQSVHCDCQKLRSRFPTMQDYIDSQKATNKGMMEIEVGDDCRICFDIHAFQKKAIAQAVRRQEAVEKKEEERVRLACPPTGPALGRATWTFLHTMAAYYPERPCPEKQQHARHFFATFGHMYPCDECAGHFRAYIERLPPDVSSRDTLVQWLCRAHNDVNRRLGKLPFDCSRALERWRTGWTTCAEEVEPEEWRVDHALDDVGEK